MACGGDLLRDDVGLLSPVRSARRHRIGTAHAKHVMTTTEPVPIPPTETLDARLVWIGKDDRGVELEIVALDLPDAIIVIHVMPTELGR